MITATDARYRATEGAEKRKRKDLQEINDSILLASAQGEHEIAIYDLDVRPYEELLLTNGYKVRYINFSTTIISWKE
jgi:hypothetical protein